MIFLKQTKPPLLLIVRVQAYKTFYQSHMDHLVLYLATRLLLLYIIMVTCQAKQDEFVH